MVTFTSLLLSTRNNLLQNMLPQLQIIPAALSIYLNCMKIRHYIQQWLYCCTQREFSGLRSLSLYEQQGHISAHSHSSPAKSIDLPKKNFLWFHLSTASFNPRYICLKPDAWNLYLIEARLSYHPWSLSIAVTLLFHILHSHLRLSFAEVFAIILQNSNKEKDKWKNTSNIRIVNCILKQNKVGRMIRSSTFYKNKQKKKSLENQERKISVPQGKDTKHYLKQGVLLKQYSS